MGTNNSFLALNFGAPFIPDSIHHIDDVGVDASMTDFESKHLKSK